MKESFLKALINSHHSYKFFFLFLLPSIIVVFSRFSPSFWKEWISFLIFILTILIIFLIWFNVSKKLPQNKKGKIGIVVGLIGENNEQKIKLKKDFIDKLKKDLLKAQRHKIQFEVIELNEYVTNNILNTEYRKKHIIKLNKQIKGHLFIYGDIKERKDGGKDKYYINFSHLMFHGDIEGNIKERLQKNINITAVRGHFDKGEEVKGFALTSELVSFGVKYLIGIAGLINGNLTFAYTIHSNILKSELKKIKASLHYYEILNELEKTVTEECDVICDILLKQNSLTNGKIFINKMIEIGIERYKGLLLRSIYEFKNGEIDKALKTLLKAKNEQSTKKFGEWRFSKCFLLIWNEEYLRFNIEKKLLIKKCKKNDFSDDFIQDMILFCDNELKNNPEKKQINFWAGFILYQFKGNLAQSLKYFEKFAENIGEGNILREENKKYIKHIKERINIK